MNFTKIQTITNLSTFPPYSKNEPELMCIAEKDGKFGVVESDSKVVLPFDYDNIFVISFGVFLVSQKGKSGIVHLTKTKSEDITVKTIIPCEYDHVYTHKQTAILQKNALSHYATQLYFVSNGELTEEFENIYIEESGYIGLQTGNKRAIVDAVNGKFIENDSDYYVVYMDFTKHGRVIVESSINKGLKLIFVVNGKQRSLTTDGIISPLYDEDSEGNMIISGYEIREDDFVYCVDTKGLLIRK